MSTLKVYKANFLYPAFGPDVECADHFVVVHEESDQKVGGFMKIRGGPQDDLWQWKQVFRRYPRSGEARDRPKFQERPSIGRSEGPADRYLLNQSSLGWRKK